MIDSLRDAMQFRCIGPRATPIASGNARLSRRGGHDAAVAVGEASRDALAPIESALIVPGEQADTSGLHHRVRLNAAGRTGSRLLGETCSGSSVHAAGYRVVTPAARRETR